MNLEAFISWLFSSCFQYFGDSIERKHQAVFMEIPTSSVGTHVEIGR
jgi:hypothetical protein